MPVVDLQLAPTTGPAERNIAQAMRCCQARVGIRPLDGVPTRATLPELRLTSVSARDSSSHRLSPQPAHPQLGPPAQAVHRSSPEPRFHIKFEEIFGSMKMIGPRITAGSPVRNAHIGQVIWSAPREI